MTPHSAYLTFRRDVRTSVKYNATLTKEGKAKERNTCGVEVVRYKMKTYDFSCHSSGTIRHFHFVQESRSHRLGQGIFKSKEQNG